MKTLVKNARFVALPLFLALAYCGATPATVTKTVDDAVACAFGIVATASGSIDVNGLLACGLTVADALALLQELRSQGGLDAGTAALAPERIAYVKRLDVAIAQLQAMQSDAGK